MIPAVIQHLVIFVASLRVALAAPQQVVRVKPSVPQARAIGARRLAASALDLKGAVAPPENLKTINHDKEAGNGYQPGSPLYTKQQALKKGKDAASKVFDPASPSWWVVVLSLIVGILSIAGVAFMNKSRLQFKEPPRHAMQPPMSQQQMQGLPPDAHYARQQMPPMGQGQPAMPMSATYAGAPPTYGFQGQTRAGPPPGGFAVAPQAGAGQYQDAGSMRM